MERVTEIGYSWLWLRLWCAIGVKRVPCCFKMIVAVESVFAHDNKARHSQPRPTSQPATRENLVTVGKGIASR